MHEDIWRHRENYRARENWPSVFGKRQDLARLEEIALQHAVAAFLYAVGSVRRANRVARTVPPHSHSLA